MKSCVGTSIFQQIFGLMEVEVVFVLSALHRTQVYIIALFSPPCIQNFRDDSFDS